MEKYFNIAGPCIPGEHYMLPALDRMPEIRRLIARRQYFVVHAPRQTGKTTAMKALVREINAKGDMVALYCTLETLQNATDAVMKWSGGQPWLVNALARECIEDIHDFNYGEEITSADIETAKEIIIRRRDTHVDSLMERLRERRVRRIVEPIISGSANMVSVNDEDYRFVQDLGLLREERGMLVPANRMYAEIIGRYLSRDEQTRMMQSVPQTPWATENGLDMPGLMEAFQAFWRENSGADRRAYEYGEATPHLVLMAFLQRVTNGQGRILREMALGSGRLDLCVEFRDKRYAVEVKTAKNFKGEKSYAQLASYLDTLGLSEGWMPVFDNESEKPWEERLFRNDVEFDGKSIHVIGL